jgi:hypothetical protein
MLSNIGFTSFTGMLLSGHVYYRYNYGPEVMSGETAVKRRGLFILQ